MATEIRHLRRRNVIERHVLQIIRGKNLWLLLKQREKEQYGLTNQATDALCFWYLREISSRYGLEIMPIDTQYLSVSELWLLRWLAEGQRYSGLRSVHITDPDFLASLLKSAQVLKGTGLFLPAATLSISVQCHEVSMTLNSAKGSDAGLRSPVIARPHEGFSMFASETPT